MARRDSKNYVSGWCRPEKRRAIYERDDHRCVYCGVSIYEDESMVLTLDHVVPRELSGTNDASNLVTACKSCNCSKQHKTTAKFIGYLAEKCNVNPDDVARRIRNAVRRKVRK